VSFNFHVHIGAETVLYIVFIVSSSWSFYSVFVVSIYGVIVYLYRSTRCSQLLLVYIYDKRLQNLSCKNIPL